MPARRVLVVVSDPAVRTLIARSLADAGYEVDCASDGEEGFEKARASRPDLVVIDREGKAWSAADIRRRMKTVESLRSVPILGLMPPREADTEREARVAGFDGYAEIPQSPEQIRLFLDRVRRCLRIADLLADADERNRILRAAREKLHSELELARLIHADPIGSNSRKPPTGQKVIVLAFVSTYVTVLSKSLEAEGLEVQVLSLSPDCLTKINARAKNVIVIDLLGLGGGPDLCRQIKAHKELGEVPVILLTDLGDDQNRVVGLLSSADHCMRRPTTPEELRGLIGQVRSLIP